MLLQLPAGILWCSLGSTDHICPLQGLSHGLAMRRGVSWWGAWCSFGTAGSPEEQLCQAGTSWSSWLYQPREIPSGGGFASHSRLELPLDWLLPQSRWPGLCSHLGQLIRLVMNDGNLPTSSSHLASSTCLSASSTIFSTSLMGEGFLAGDGLCTREGDLLPLAASSSLSFFG